MGSMIPPMAETRGESHPTRSSLLRRVKNPEDEVSWREFYDLYAKVVLRFALKAGLTEDEAEEVVQETMIGAAKNLPEFRYDPKVCSFRTWLLNLSRWRVQDQLRKRHASGAAQGSGPRPEASEEPDRTATAMRVPDPAGSKLEAIWDAEWRTTLLDAALVRVKTRVDARQWQIFDLYALQEWPVTKVAKALGVSAGRVYLTKHRISLLLKSELKRLERMQWAESVSP
jgi:RNA polymerase sigma factor (sigma-70 family)